MAYDENLAQRVREILLGSANIREMKMFGGIAFLLNGNMACGVVGDDLLVRVGPDAYEQDLATPHVKPFAMTGRAPMSGWVRIEPDGIATEKALQERVNQGLQYAATLPPKRK